MKMKEKMTITKNPKEILEKIVEIHGIDTIRDFMKRYNKKTRKNQPRTNDYDVIAYKVYNLMFEDDYSKTRAIDKIADNHSLKNNTVRNHCAKFDEEAKEENYYSFGVAVDKKYKDDPYNSTRYNTEGMLHRVINNLADENNIPNRNAEAYYYKYKTCKKRNIPKDINSALFYKGFIDMSDIPF